MQFPNVFIVLLNWNGWKDTIECLDSLKNLDYPNYEIVVVDNGSTDESVTEISKIKSQISNLTLLTNQENLGFSGGNNTGIRYALSRGAEYILILNNDTTVESDFLTRMVEVAESDQKIGMVGAKICFYDKPNTIWHNGGGSFNWFTGSTPKDHGRPDAQNEERPSELDFITAACVLVKQEIIKKIGMLDERFFLYYEDVEWSLRARKAGFKLLWAPKAKIYHKVHASAGKLADPVIWYYHVRNVLLTVREHAPFYVKPLVYVWAFWRWWVKQYTKQILWPARREEAQFIRKGLEDFWACRFGKLANYTND